MIVALFDHRPVCACGCGSPVGAAVTSNAKYRKGEVYRYRQGHHLRGEHHHSWRGGRKAHTRGYTRVLAPGHPRATADGYVLEHILVAEGKIGRRLARGEVVHHINADPTDNRPENLAVLENQAAHVRLHAAERRVQKAAS